MSQTQTYKAIVVDPNTWQAKLNDLPLQKPSTNQVLVKVEFSPVNPTDLYKIRGFYGKPSDIPSSVTGSEGSGTIVAVGDNLKVPHKVGDRVHLIGGVWQQYILLNSEQVYPVADALSLEEAASHFINPATVYYMGVVADQGGHKAAIHTLGASALGRMLIRYFKHKGIKLINIVRNDAYIDQLKQEEGADYVLNSEDPNFESELKEIAEREGATIAFDGIGGEFTNIILRNQPDKSVTYSYGALYGGNEVKSINIRELFKGKAVVGLFLPNYIHELSKKERDVSEFMNEVHSLLPTVFRSKVHKVFSFEDYKEAIEYYNTNSSKGKILLKFN